MAFKLRTAQTARSAYSILVSEEALRVGTAKAFQGAEPIKKPDFPKNATFTRFQRVREDLDEDSVNIIQHAGRKLSDRVEDILGKLLKTEWLLVDIPEFQRLASFNKSLYSSSSYRNENYLRGLTSNMLRRLTAYVRGRVLFCLMLNITDQQSTIGTTHRQLENWAGTVVEEYHVVYNHFADKERMMTRAFWEILRGLNWNVDQGMGGDGETNHVRDVLPGKELHSSIVF